MHFEHFLDVLHEEFECLMQFKNKAVPASKIEIACKTSEQASSSI